MIADTFVMFHEAILYYFFWSWFVLFYLLYKTFGRLDLIIVMKLFTLIYFFMSFLSLYELLV